MEATSAAMGHRNWLNQPLYDSQQLGYGGCESAAERLSPARPSSGQATTSPPMRHPKILACHSEAAFKGSLLRNMS